MGSGSAPVPQAKPGDPQLSGIPPSWPLGVSADPPAQTGSPKPSQASQEGGLACDLPGLGRGESVLSASLLLHSLS